MQTLRWFAFWGTGDDLFAGMAGIRTSANTRKIPAKRPFQNANASLVCILGYEIATFDKKLLRLISGN